MNIVKIDARVSVCSQVWPDDVVRIAGQGFRSMICNRPDYEAPDQPTFAEVDAAAQKAGLPTRYIPFASGQFTEADAEAFLQALKALPHPILAYCRSGARSAGIYKAASAM